MLSVLRAEWLKLRKANVTGIIFAAPVLGSFIGLGYDLKTDVDINQWYLMLLGMNLPYGLLFLPLTTGVLAAAVCRYEHQAGGWKQFLALPVTRGQVYFAKFLVVLFLVLAMQLLYFGVLYGVGKMNGLTDPFPANVLYKSLIGGWVAAFPIIALQLWMSLFFKSLAAPLAVNVIFTLPAILAVNSEHFGPYYPWAQPFLMMYVGTNPEDVFFVPWEQVLTVVGGSFLIFFLGGFLYFQRKMV